MTVLEQRFYQLVPDYLRVIADTMKVISKSLNEKEDESDKETSGEGDL